YSRQSVLSLAGLEICQVDARGNDADVLAAAAVVLDQRGLCPLRPSNEARGAAENASLDQLLRAGSNRALLLEIVPVAHQLLVERGAVGGKDRRLAAKIPSRRQRDGVGVDEEAIHLVEDPGDRSARANAAQDRPGKRARLEPDRHPERFEP